MDEELRDIAETIKNRFDKLLDEDLSTERIYLNIFDYMGDMLEVYARKDKLTADELREFILWFSRTLKQIASSDYEVD